MSDEEKEILEYNLNILRGIASKCDNLYENLKNMENTIKSNMLIDNVAPGNNIINSCYNNTDIASNRIWYSIIPSIKNKIY